MAKRNNCLFASAGLILTVLSLPVKAQQTPIVFDEGGDRIMAMQSDTFGAVEMGGQTASGDFIVHFSGQCAANLAPIFMVMDPEALRRFQQSGELSALGGGDFLRNGLDLLLQVCPSMTSAEPRLGNMPDTPTIARLERSNGWREASGATPGKLLTVAMRDDNSSAFVDHQPRCGREIAIPLQSSQTGRRTPQIDQYQAFANEVAARVAQECGDVQSIRFNVQVLPENTSCAYAGGGCFLVGTRQEETASWDVQPDNILLARGGREAVEIEDFSEMIALLEKGQKAAVLDNHTGYFRLFHNVFLRSYSDNCAQHIENPTVFEVTPIERSVDGFANTNSETQTGDSYLLTINQKHVSPYRNYESLNRGWLTSRILSFEADGRRSNRAGTGTTQVYGQFMRDREQVARFVAEGCTAPSVQAVYLSL